MATGVQTIKQAIWLLILDHTYVYLNSRGSFIESKIVLTKAASLCNHHTLTRMQMWPCRLLSDAKVFSPEKVLEEDFAYPELTVLLTFTSPRLEHHHCRAEMHKCKRVVVAAGLLGYAVSLQTILPKHVLETGYSWRKTNMFRVCPPSSSTRLEPNWAFVHQENLFA